MIKQKYITEETDGASEVITWNTALSKLKLNANKGYNSDVTLLASLKDTGNGYIFKFPSYSSIEQDNYVCIDYAEADYIFKLLSFLYSQSKGVTIAK